MKTQFLAVSLVMALLSMLFCSPVKADALTGFSDVTVVGGAIVSLRYEGTEYVVANEDLMLGTTTRWYIPAATGVATLWAEGDPVPPATVTGTSDPKAPDVGSKGDNFLFTLNGSTNISSIDGINFQETIFPLPTQTIFVFERGGNDTGTYQAILPNGSLGAPVSFSGASHYANTNVGVNGQNAFGVVFTTDVRVQGVRITASGHDTLSISAIPISSDPRQSHDPQPEDGATDVPRDVVLSWAAGEGAATVNGHVLYFSASLDAVNDGVGGVTLTATSYDPGRLEFGQTYYWRVDEAGAAPDSTVFPGDVWSFTVEPYAYPVAHVTATASSAQPGMGPEETINGSGLNADDQHGTELTDMWLSIGVLPNWIQYQFDRVYQLYELWVWNSNQVIETFVGFGAKDVTIESSLDGSAWAELAEVPEFAQATGLATYTHNTTVPFGGVQAKYVKLTIGRTWGGLNQSSLSEVRFLYVPVRARGPEPADGATGVDIEATLTWRPGREAATHTVYFGENKDAVTAGTTPAETVADPSFSPATLAYGTTYYWRVDEVNEAMTSSVHEGAVWSFTTQEYAVVDDFESYTDDEGNRIYETWLDGYEIPANGSQVGYAEAPFAERVIVHGGRQSMPLSYDNTAGATVSEAERTFAMPQDWTRAGIATLVVHFRGAPDNTTGRLYLKISGVKVPYDGDPAAMQAVSWTPWQVHLASVNTNLKKVTRLALGVDSGGAGILYVDDIRLLPAAPVFTTTLTVGPADSLESTGDNGMVLSINGIDVGNLVLGTTTADFEKYADHPAAHADDFDLGTYASLDESTSITTRFAVPVTTVFIIERGANDQGFLQPLDAGGKPVGSPQPFVGAHWFKPGVKINGQDAGAIAITATTPISGISLLPPAGGVTGIDPASISGLPAN